jgi:hypothetical protein
MPYANAIVRHHAIVKATVARFDSFGQTMSGDINVKPQTRLVESASVLIDTAAIKTGIG